MKRGIGQKTRKLAITMMLLFFVAVFASAQANTGAISGVVTDPTGAAIVGAKLTITNQATGVSRELVTDNSGFYSAEGLTAGEYKIEVRASGFKQSTTTAVQLDPGQRRGNNIRLEMGASTSDVTVTANAVQVNTESSESGGTISGEQVQSLMLNGRNFQTLAITIPGVSSTRAGDSLGGGGLFGSTTLIVNGNSVEYTTYTIDGIYNMNSGNLANINILPILEGISEFSVLKDNYSAKYGFAGSGQIVVETKSGSRTFHGSAWEFARNNAFDANNYFSTSTPALHQNIYGYSLGGPVIIPWLYNTDRSKKTFFFASDEWRTISSASVIRGAVFPQAMRDGDLTASPTLSGPLTLDAHSQSLLAAQGKSNCISSPTTLNPACLDPIAVGLLKAYVPLPNNPGGGFLNYINLDPRRDTQIDHQYRGDHQINKNNLLIARIMYEQVLNGFPNDTWSGTPYNTITDAFYTTGFNGLVRVQSSITPNLLNTATIAETDDRPHILLRKGGGTMPDGLSIIQAFPDAPTLNRIPNIGIGQGWSGNGVGSQPISASDGEGMIADDVSWIRGRHVLQGGALYMFGIKRQTVFTNPQGSFNFSGVHTGDPAADYLLGLDSNYSQASSEREGAFHYRQGEAYFQDDWKIAPRLVLNLGLRWVYFSNDTVSGSQVTSFKPSLFDPAQAPVVNTDGQFTLNSANQPLTSIGTVANLLNGIVFAGKNGVPHGFFIPKKTNFAPRVGFAYDLTGKGTMSLRGGYGIGYSRIPVAVIYYAFGQNPPYNLSANIFNSLLSDGTAGGTAAAPTTQNLNDVPFEFTPTQIQSFSLSLERQIKNNLVGTLAYAGSVSRHVTSGVGGGNDINWPLAVSSPSATGCLTGQPSAASYDFDPCINAGISSSDYTRPYSGYSGINYQYDSGTANYNALQAALNYHFGPSQFSLGYAWSKTLATVAGHGAGSTTSQSAGPQNPRDWAAEYGPPSYDFTHDVTASWVYALPFFRDGNPVFKSTLGGWSLGGLFVHQSGFALSPGMSTPTNGLASRPNQVASFHKVGRVDEWFDTNAYAAPTFGFYGDSRNGSIRGPGYTSFNVSLNKTIPIVERLALDFRAEAFNVLNHPNFQGVDTGLGSGSYGQVTSAGDPRILEFALRVSF